MNRTLQEDLFRYVGTDCSKLRVQLRYVLFTPGFRYIYFFRHASQASNPLARFFWTVLLRLCMLRTGIQIPPRTQIGRGFRIVHFGTIVVNPQARIGRNFNLSQGTLIGNSGGRRRGTPTIGDNVCMNANSAVVGGVTIGDNVLIAPGAFVNFDVPSDSVVVGNPGKIIPKVRPTDQYIVYPLKLDA